MAVGLRRRGNPYGATGFFGYDDTQEQPGYMGFEQVAGVGDAPLPVQTEDQPQLITPIDQAQQPTNDDGFLSSIFGGGALPSQASIDRRQKLAEGLIAQGSQTGEIHSPWEALGRVAQQWTGAYLQSKAEKDAERVTKHRQDQLKGALGDGGDLGAMADKLLASDDPDLVDKGLQIKMQLATQGAKTARKPNPTRNYNRGGEEVTEEWDDAAQAWKPLATAPRYKAGGGGGNDDADAIGGGGGPFPKKVARVIAYNAMRGDPRALMGLSRANGGAQLRQVMAEMVAIGEEQGLSEEQIGSQLAMVRSQYAGFMSGQKAVGTRGGQLELAATAAKGMGKIARDASKKVPRGNFIPLNRLQQLIAGNTGDPNIKAFNGAVTTFINGYTRAVTPVGAPTDAKAQHAYDMLSTAQTQEQFDAVMDILEQEMDTELAAVQQTRDQLGGDFMGEEEQPQQEWAPPGSTAAAAPPQDGATKVVAGKTYVRKGGRWYPQGGK